MSESGPTASDEARDGQENDSVLDFLYHDARRVGSFLAQFDPSGHLQQIRDSESVAKGAKRGWKFGLGGAVTEGLGKGEISYERSPLQGGTEASERVYDPLWSNARELLDYLEDRKLIQRDLPNAKMGQFVLVKGMLLVLDLAMIKGAWEKSSVKKLISGGLEAERKKLKGKPSAVPPGMSDMQLVIDLLGILPHTLQATVLDDEFRVWCCLSEASLVGLSSDIILKHGSYIPGEWSLLGVLDAYPDVRPDPVAGQAPTQSIDEMVAVLAGTVVGTVAAQMAPAAREILGRPRIAYGVTPLLIFREVSSEPPDVVPEDSAAKEGG
jgi:hypothetical protein